MTTELHDLLDNDPAAGLRGVAALMRDIDGYDEPFVFAVANLLDEVAGDHEHHRNRMAAAFGEDAVDDYMPPVPSRTLAVARAYLGPR